MEIYEYPVGCEFYVLRDVGGGALLKKDDFVVIESRGPEESLSGHGLDIVYRLLSRSSGEYFYPTEKYLNQLDEDGTLIYLGAPEEEKMPKRKGKKKSGRAGHPLTQIFK
jgi:hypothetical protein